MRDIKFRFWDKDLKKMCFRHPARMDFSHPNIIPMQYTGHTDKNKAEIYEGDICECRMVGIETHIEILKAQINHVHVAAAFAFEVIGSDSDYRIFAFNSTNILSVEVIGNIYEHPHLMEGGTV